MTGVDINIMVCYTERVTANALYLQKGSNYMYTLYGDGVHDDTLALQELLDTKKEIILPEPDAFYLVSKTLLIGSNTRLVLPRFAEIRLKDGSNCPLLRNKTVDKPAERLPAGLGAWQKFLALHENKYSPDPEDTTVNIEIVGGIWNFNNMGQNPNPLQSKDMSIPDFTGYGMLFHNVKNFRLSSLTLKDPTNFAVTLDRTSYFNVDDITFDYNNGNPVSLNMDGIHVNGNCYFGCIRNLRGACRDDLVALNADEGSGGPISDILVDGVFAEECHSAVRLLSVKYPVERVRITNVYGTYYQYCVGISKFYPGEHASFFDAITLDHIYAAKAERKPHLHPNPKGYVYPLIWVEGNLRVRNLSVTALHRREYNVAVETLHIGPNTAIENLILDDITEENRSGLEMPFLVNKGKVICGTVRNVRAEGAIVNAGEMPGDMLTALGV